MFQTKAVERINTHIMFNKNVPHIRAFFFFFKDNVEKYVTARQVTGDNIIRLCALYAGYRLQTNSQNIWYSLLFDATVVTRMRLVVEFTYITYLVNFRGPVWLTMTIPHRKWDALQSDFWAMNARYHLLHEVIPDEVSLVFSPVSP